MCEMLVGFVFSLSNSRKNLTGLNLVTEKSSDF